MVFERNVSNFGEWNSPFYKSLSLTPSCHCAGNITQIINIVKLYSKSIIYHVYFLWHIKSCFLPKTSVKSTFGHTYTSKQFYRGFELEKIIFPEVFTTITILDSNIRVSPYGLCDNYESNLQGIPCTKPSWNS